MSNETIIINKDFSKMQDDKDSKITYVDFNSLKQSKEKPALDAPLHTNPVIDKLFKFMHVKLSDKKNKYESYSEFKPDDLL